MRSLTFARSACFLTTSTTVIFLSLTTELHHCVYLTYHRTALRFKRFLIGLKKEMIADWFLMRHFLIWTNIEILVIRLVIVLKGVPWIILTITATIAQGQHQTTLLQKKKNMSDILQNYKTKFHMKANIISCITTIMCRYEKCPQNPLMPSHHPLRHDSSVVRNSYFFEALETFPWRREWVKAVLRCLRRKEAIAPSDQPIPSLQALEYLEMLGLKIARGMKKHSVWGNLRRMESTLKRIGLGPSSLEARRLWICQKYSILQTDDGWAILRNHFVQEARRVVHLRATGIQSFWHRRDLRLVTRLWQYPNTRRRWVMDEVWNTKH